MENNESDKEAKEIVSKVQSDMINAFEWVQGIYDESYKLLKAIVTHFQEKGILMVKNPPIEMSNFKSYYTRILAQYLVVSKEKETTVIGVTGIRVFDEKEKPSPRLIFKYIKLDRSIGKESFEQRKMGWGAQYEIVKCKSINDDEANVFITLSKEKWRPKTTGKADNYKVVSASFTHVPLASIDSLDTLHALLESATPFFQDGIAEAKLKNKVQELRAQVI
ncbi:MAG: hypothetical protein M1428_00860 [Deltaproteobacteria bacterium]|nr:hypothetical protein [Deltaproteobacteria bacterium]